MKNVAADVSHALSKLDAIQSDNNRNYDQLRTEIGRQNKLPVGNILIAVTMILGLVGSWGLAVVAPIKLVQEYTIDAGKERFVSIEGDVADNRNRIRGLEADMRAAQAKNMADLREIETQFKAFKTLNTVVNAYNAQTDQLLWQKAYGESMPILHSPTLGLNGDH